MRDIYGRLYTSIIFSKMPLFFHIITRSLSFFFLFLAKKKDLSFFFLTGYNYKIPFFSIDFLYFGGSEYSSITISICYVINGAQRTDYKTPSTI